MQQERGGQEEFGPYELVENWPQPLPDGPDGVKHEGWTWGSLGAVYAESPDRIWIAQRGELPLPAGARPWTPYSQLTPTRGNATGNDDGLSATCGPAQKRGWERRYHHVIFVVDRAGKLVEWWPQHDPLFAAPCGRGPHKIKMSPYDPDRHVWVFDDQLHVIYKFTYDGKLVLTLGTKGQRGRDGGRLFDRPTDIAWLPDGTFFITDGYGGTRVAKFDRHGKFLMDWGGPPKDATRPGPNEFNTVHSIAISNDRRLFVVDRGHRRFQVFDENGKFLDMWTTGMRSSPYAHFISTDQFLWVADGGTHRILKYDLNGKYLYGWGGFGGLPGQFNGPHSLTVDQEGNLYTAEVFAGRVQKFRPKRNADPAKVVGQEPREILQAHDIALDNEYVRVTRNAAPCASAGPTCRDRVIVALGDVALVSGTARRKLVRGEIAVFGPGESYRTPTGTYFEVAIKPGHPPLASPSEYIPPSKNAVVHDSDRLFIFEERLAVGETRARHSHRPRVVIQLNRTRLQQWPDGAAEVIRDIVPDQAAFNPPVIHTVKNVGDLPLRGIVIELKARP